MIFHSYLLPLILFSLVALAVMRDMKRDTRRDQLKEIDQKVSHLETICEYESRERN